MGGLRMSNQLQCKHPVPTDLTYVHVRDFEDEYFFTISDTMYVVNSQEHVRFTRLHLKVLGVFI